MKKLITLVMLALMCASFTVRGQWITNAFEYVDSQNRLHVDYNSAVNGNAVILDFFNVTYANDTAVIGANSIVTGVLAPGTYSTMVLRVTNGNSHENWQIPTFTIIGAPTITLSANPTSGNAPLNTTFTVATTGIVDSVLLNFGDGQSAVFFTGSVQTPHTYSVAGTYNAQATAYGPGGMTASNTVTITANAQVPNMHWISTVVNGHVATIVFYTHVGGTFSVSPTPPFSTVTTSVVAGENTIVMDPLPSGTYNTLVFTVLTAGGVSEDLHIPTFVIADNPPTADFVGNPTSGPAPLAVQFTDLSTPGTNPITSWYWTFGDGTTSNVQHPNHTYTAPGLYTVSLTVSDGSLSNTMTRVEYINVGQNVVGPIADFVGSPTTGTAPLLVQFTDLSTSGTNPITSWYWTFGDGATSNVQHPNHTYNAPGLYTVTLTVSDGSLSNTMTRVEYINVGQNVVGPIADFVGSPTTGTSPLLVQFTDLSTAGTNPIISWYWSFGDGTTSNVQHPAHVYTSVGVYTVTLVVSNGTLSDTLTRVHYIEVTEVIPIGPTADFKGVPTSGNAPLNVQFTDLSLPGSNPIISWYWTFGDGDVSTLQHPAHTYSAPGLYTVSLTVSDGSLSDTMIRTGYIFVKAGQGPTADFVACPLTGNAPLSVNFTDKSIPGSNPITSWKWYFGDGSTSIDQHPNHVYTAPGLYTVKLVVSDGSLSDTAVRVDYIEVTQGGTTGPQADFIGIPTSGNAPLAVSFINFSVAGTDSITSYIWNFGDGHTSTEKHPAHTYNTPGVYTVTLYVSDGTLSDIMTRMEYIEVFPAISGLIADFIVEPPAGTAPFTTRFINLSHGNLPITSSLWNFGDGSTSSLKHPVHTFTQAGSYRVELMVSDGVHTDTTSTMVIVSPPVSLDIVKWEMWSWYTDPLIAYPGEVIQYELTLTTQPDSLRLLINGERAMLGWSFGATYQGTFSVPDSMATGYPTITIGAWKNGQLVNEEFLGEVFIKGYDKFPKLIRVQSNHLFTPSPQGGTVYQATVGDHILLEFNGRQPEEVFFLGREAILMLNEEEDLWYTEVTVTESDLARDVADFVVRYKDLNSSTMTTDGSSVKLIPLNQQLLPCYPNPVNQSSFTTIQFNLEKRSYVRLEIFNILSQKVVTLEEGVFEAGFKTHTWHTDTLAKGTYVCRLVTFDDLSNGKAVDAQSIKIVVQ